MQYTDSIAACRHIFNEKILSLLEKTGVDRLSIILNGKYLLYHSKMVYVKLTRNVEFGINELRYFIKRVDKPREMKAEAVDVTLAEEIMSTELYGIDLKIPFNWNDCKIVIDQDMSLLIIETGIYRIAREFACNKDSLTASKIIVNVSNENTVEKIEITDRESLKNLVRIFKERSYRNFSSVVFCRLSNKFIARFYSRANSFYKILYSFIPVFIYYPNLYNPIFDNPDNLVEHLQLYKLAVEKGRIAGNPEGLHAYMLTHEEICRACSMTHFMRFTPSFFYELLVGLLNPTLDTFPSVTNKIFVKPEILDDPLGNKLPRCYTRMNYIFELQRCNEAKNDKAAQKKFEILRQYIEKDALYYCCERNIKNLFNYGPSVIDPPKITVETVYSYLQEMRLL